MQYIRSLLTQLFSPSFLEWWKPSCLTFQVRVLSVLPCFTWVWCFLRPNRCPSSPPPFRTQRMPIRLHGIPGRIKPNPGPRKNRRSPRLPGSRDNRRCRSLRWLASSPPLPRGPSLKNRSSDLGIKTLTWKHPERRSKRNRRSCRPHAKGKPWNLMSRPSLKLNLQP